MYPESSVWLIIVLAIICANVPFLTERMFAFVPVRMKGEPEKFAGFYLIRAFVFYGVMGCAFYLTTEVVLPMSAKLFGLVLFIVLFAMPGFLYSRYVAVKPVWARMVELLLLVCFIAAVGFFIESYYANRFTQSWQFYAIGICLFVLLAFPGFVWRHLMRHPGLGQGHME
ncbi:DUF2818 family protein [Pelistega europaea]|uniref:DUF2818 family protein n=1 Tax=Pelistega europaea TaxID=106147 RepID=A0A7Y4LDG1_9BURK|nr:DUF2818 family protein [Pelistega europaea]NOL50201.1 DUF2818 family protein [Pelistega europaea]